MDAGRFKETSNHPVTPGTKYKSVTMYKSLKGVSLYKENLEYSTVAEYFRGIEAPKKEWFPLFFLYSYNF